MCCPRRVAGYINSWLISPTPRDTEGISASQRSSGRTMRFVAAASAESRPSRIVDSTGPGSAGRGRAPGRVGAAYFAPLLGYWILAAAVTINPQIQWSLAVFGPILALTAWLIVLRGGDAPDAESETESEEEVPGNLD